MPVRPIPQSWPGAGSRSDSALRKRRKLVVPTAERSSSNRKRVTFLCVNFWSAPFFRVVLLTQTHKSILAQSCQANPTLAAEQPCRPMNAKKHRAGHLLVEATLRKLGWMKPLGKFLPSYPGHVPPIKSPLKLPNFKRTGQTPSRSRSNSLWKPVKCPLKLAQLQSYAPRNRSHPPPETGQIPVKLFTYSLRLRFQPKAFWPRRATPSVCNKDS